MSLPTHYKAEGQTRHGPCLICQTLTRGAVVKVYLGYGEWVQLCRGHASEGFRKSRGGRDFAASISAALKSAGRISKTMGKALDRIFAQLTAPPPPPDNDAAKPGSYAWAGARKAVELACSKGVVAITSLVAVALQQIGKMALRTVKAPSERTIRRWREDRRWVLPGWKPPS